jgi:hypothetical protein
MNITIFGASGGIGSLLTKEALDKGDSVTAYVRNPQKIKLSHKNLEVAVGQLTDMTEIENAIAGADVVISALGPDMKSKRSDMGTPVADGHASIVAVMKKLGKKRFVTLTTPNVSADEDVKNFATVFPKIMARMFLPSGCRDIIKTGEIVKASGLDWSVVRIISPNAKSDGDGYGYSLDGKNAKISVSRKNVARLMLDVAKDDQFIHRMPIVFNK